MSSERPAVPVLGRWLALVCGIAIAGCTPEMSGRTSDCASGLVCTTVGACVVPPVDAGTDGEPASIDAASTTTTIRDGDGDAFDIEPFGDAPQLDADLIDAPQLDADLIDAPPDDGLARNFEGAW